MSGSQPYLFDQSTSTLRSSNKTLPNAPSNFSSLSPSAQPLPTNFTAQPRSPPMQSSQLHGQSLMRSHSTFSDTGSVYGGGGASFTEAGSPRSPASPRPEFSSAYYPMGLCPRIDLDSSEKLSRYLRRLFKFGQMDFEYASWQMLYLIIAPQKVYRNFQYRKHMKNQWARDDPAFLVLFCLALCVSSLFIAFTLHLGVLDTLKLLAWVVLVDCIGLGLLIASLLWFIANNYLHINTRDPRSRHARQAHTGGAFVSTNPFLGLIHTVLDQLSMFWQDIRARFFGSGPTYTRYSHPSGASVGGGGSLASHDDKVEFAYAFDVHLNSLFPGLILVHVVQLPVLYFIINHSEMFWSVLLGNSCWLMAAGYYLYITFLGFSALPYLRNTRLFLTPGSVLLSLFFVSLIFRWNLTASLCSFYEYRLGSMPEGP